MARGSGVGRRWEGRGSSYNGRCSETPPGAAPGGRGSCAVRLARALTSSVQCTPAHAQYTPLPPNVALQFASPPPLCWRPSAVKRQISFLWIGRQRALQSHPSVPSSLQLASSLAEGYCWQRQQPKQKRGDVRHFFLCCVSFGENPRSKEREKKCTTHSD